MSLFRPYLVLQVSLFCPDFAQLNMSLYPFWLTKGPVFGTNGRTDGRTDRQTEGGTDLVIYRGAKCLYGILLTTKVNLRPYFCPCLLLVALSLSLTFSGIQMPTARQRKLSVLRRKQRKGFTLRSEL